MSAPVVHNPHSKAEQARMLAEHLEKVREQAVLMKRNVDKNDFKESVRHAALMLNELRTGWLSPKTYYELYLEIFGHLSFLEVYFMQLQRGGMPMSELYVSVQHAGTVLVRLYLLATAGSAYLKSGQVGARVLLNDLMEMVKGVQHPQRALFMRYYLHQKIKDKLPDASTPYEGAGGNVRDAVDVVIRNFGEMNRLWVRMQNAGSAAKGRKRRERERQDLRVLVGAPLTRLSTLSGLDLTLYSAEVLPRLIAEITSCKDDLAQQHLFDSLIQVFPVEFHYRTLDTLLAALRGFMPHHVVIKACYLTLLQRLQADMTAAATASAQGADASASAGDTPTGPPADVDVFGSFLRSLHTMAADENGPFRREQGTPGLEAADALSPAPSDNLAILRTTMAALANSGAIGSLVDVYNALLSFTLECWPGNIARVDETLAGCAESLQEALNLPPPPEGAATAAAASASEEPADPDAAPVVASAAARSALTRLVGVDMSLPPPEPEAVHDADDLAVPAVSLTSIGRLGAGGAGRKRVVLDDACSRLLVRLLETVQTSLGLRVLSLVHYSSLLVLLRYPFRRAAASRLLAAVVAAGGRVSQPETIKRLCQALNPLLVDEADAPSGGGNPDDDPEVLRDLHNVARLINLLGGTTDEAVLAARAGAAPTAPIELDVATHLAAYKTVMAFLSSGGARRVCHTFPPLVFGCLALARRALALDRLPVAKKVFLMVHEVCTGLAATNTELALRLFVHAALAASGAAGFSFDLFSQAFILYEDIVDSKLQLRSLSLIISALETAKDMAPEDFGRLCETASGYSRKLLKKPDQVRMALLCARLMWPVPQQHADAAAPGRADGVLACLRHSLKVADACVPPVPTLFVDVLDAYVAFFEMRCPTITPRFLTDMMCLAKEQVECMRAGAEREAGTLHVRNVLAHIVRASKNDAALFADVVMPDESAVSAEQT